MRKLLLVAFVSAVDAAAASVTNSSAVVWSRTICDESPRYIGWPSAAASSSGRS